MILEKSIDCLEEQKLSESAVIMQFIKKLDDTFELAKANDDIMKLYFDSL